MLLTSFKGQGWGHTRHMLATVLWPVSLQGALQSTPMDREINLIFLWRESTPNSLADSSSLPNPFMIFFFLLLYFRKELFPAGIYVHNCWELMELASNSVYVSNGTRQGQWWQEEHMYRLSLCCLLQSLMSCWDDARQKQCKLCNKFHLEESKTFHLLGNIGMIPPGSCKLNKKMETEEELVQKSKVSIRSCWGFWAAEHNYGNGATSLETGGKFYKWEV